MTDQTPNNGRPNGAGQPPVPPVPPTNPYGQQPPAQQPAYPTQPYAQQPQQPQQPYAQQPAQQYAAPAGPGYPAGPNGPTGPMGPGGPIPPKKGLPGWALGLIIGGGVLLLAIIAGVILVVSLVMNANKPEDCSAPGSCGQGLPPVETDEPATDPTTEPDDPGTATDRIALDGAVDFGGPPVWAVPMQDGWEIITFDEGGINKFGNTTLGCTLVTSQNAQTKDPNVKSDVPATDALMSELSNQLISGVASGEVTYSGTTDIAIGSSGSGQYIEFAESQVTYTLANGNEYITELVARSMPLSGGYMWAQVDCVKSTVDAGDSPYFELLSQLAVVPGF